MCLKNVSVNFKGLVSKTNKKSEIKVYQEFIQIITSLEKKNLSETDKQSIETKLDSLHLNSTTTNNRKYFNKALEQFKTYLKDTFSLTTKGHYTALGVSFGLLFGVVISSNSEGSMGIALGFTFGMIIGQAIGRNKDSQAESLGNMV